MSHWTQSSPILAKLASPEHTPFPPLCPPCSGIANGHHICLVSMWVLGIPPSSSYLHGNYLPSWIQLPSQWRQFWLVDVWNRAGGLWHGLGLILIGQSQLCHPQSTPQTCLPSLPHACECGSWLDMLTIPNSTALTKWTRKPKPPVLNSAWNSMAMMALCRGRKAKAAEEKLQAGACKS